MGRRGEKEYKKQLSWILFGVHVDIFFMRGKDNTKRRRLTYREESG